MATSYKTLVFRLRALTNMHPGAGDSFYGAVDKLVQRDPATNRPVIHSHSLKGALREYFETGPDPVQEAVNRIFGTPVDGKPEDAKPGAYRFLSADLLAFPVPNEAVDSPETFHRCADPAALKQFLDKMQLIDPQHWGGPNTVDTLRKALEAGGLSLTDDPAKFRAAMEELPVVARNCLDNGKSENLWYEELIPRESLFLFAVQTGPTKSNGTDTTELDQKLFTERLDGQVVQIGANATVGYGFCQLTLLQPTQLA